MEFVGLKRVFLLLLMLCGLLLLIAPTADARTRRRRRAGNEEHDSKPTSPGFTHYFVIVIIVFGAILVLICLVVNSLRCILNMLGRRSRKQTERRTRHRTTAGAGHQWDGGHQADAIDQSELLPPPSYAEIVGEATAPPPAYSSLHVGDAGWDSPPGTTDDVGSRRAEEHTI